MGYRIGIQILSFNKPKYLVQTLDSLMRMKGPNDKILVFEQSTEDEIRKEGLAICKEYDDVQVILSDRNLGQRGATNRVIESGFFNDCEYVMVTDHDNIFHEKLDIYVNKLTSNPSVWVATGYNSPEHDIERKDGEWLLKTTARAGHMVLRQKDFMSMVPIDEQAGLDNGCAWFAGFDWWLTHWCPQSPGMKRAEIIAAYPGGVEHIGRESTWQGKYDDEYTVEENLKFRNSSIEEILKFYKPRHSYQNGQYWYEKDPPKANDNSDSKGDDSLIVNLFKSNFNKDLSDDELTVVKGMISKREMKKSKIIAFNYLWPSYGFTFLKKSIEAILPYVDKYVLYLNEYSYIGNQCDGQNIANVIAILNSLDMDKIDVHLNRSSDFSQSAKDNNINYYIRKCIDDYSGKSDYVWLVQSDEVYDIDMIHDVIDLCSDKSISNCLITQPICYMDNPHWFVNPHEDFDRPTVIKNDQHVDLTDKELRRDITFHHLSYVLTSDEILAKFANWGHRDDVDLDGFLVTFNQLKTNKYLSGLHPIYPMVYRNVAFTDMNEHLFHSWVRSAVGSNSPKSDIIRFVLDEFIDVPSQVVSHNTVIAYGDSPHKHYDVGLAQMCTTKDCTFFKGTIKEHIPSKLSNNNSISAVILTADELLYQNILEMQPKVRDFGWYCIFYDTDEALIEIKKLVQKAMNIDTPWGQDKFQHYEIYYDIFSDANIDTDDRCCLARVRKR